MSKQSLPDDLSLEIKRIEKRIKDAHHRIRDEVNGTPPPVWPHLFDTSDAEKEVRALEVRLQELKEGQAKLSQ